MNYYTVPMVEQGELRLNILLKIKLVLFLKFNKVETGKSKPKKLFHFWSFMKFYEVETGKSKPNKPFLYEVIKIYEDSSFPDSP